MKPRSERGGAIARGLFAAPCTTALDAQRFQSIQALRFFAALMVICCHATAHTVERLAPDSWFYYLGANGVPLFFAISGFVMLVSARQLADQPGGWRIFARRRLIRIAPLYWLITSLKLVIAIASVGFVRHARIDWLFVLKSYLFLPAVNPVSGAVETFYGVGWSLTFEMFFYLLVALCLAFRWPPLRVLGVVLPTLALLSLAKTEHAPPILVYADPLVFYFLVGMIAAELIARRILLATWAAIAALLCGVTYLFVPTAELLPFLPNSPYLYNPLLVGLSAMLTVYGAASIERVTGLGAPGWVLFLGAASYSLYLAHPTISPMAPELLKWLGIPSAPLSVALSIAASLAGGSLVYRFVEQRMSRALNRIGASRAVGGTSVPEVRAVP